MFKKMGSSLERRDCERKTMLKKAVVCLLVLVVLGCFFLNRGCQHEWSEATCEKAKTCLRCGEKTGSPLGHYYYEGNCVRCNINDPNYVDLNRLGFQTSYGMNEWMQICAYDFGEGTVTWETHGQSWDQSFDQDFLYTGSAKNGGEFETYYQNSNGVMSCNIVTNDKMEYNYYGTNLWVIYDRVVYLNKYVVLKTRMDTSEKWFIPMDMIDWSRDLVQDPYTNTGKRYLRTDISF